MAELKGSLSDFGTLKLTTIYHHAARVEEHLLRSQKKNPFPLPRYKQSQYNLQLKTDPLTTNNTTNWAMKYRILNNDSGCQIHSVG